MAHATAATLIRLARPHQWAKSIFVIIGPAYGVATGKPATWSMAVALAGAVIAFCLAASGCYIVNDIRDREADLIHPRKRTRPIASGAISVAAAARLAAGLFVAAFLATALAWVGHTLDARPAAALEATGWLVLTLILYIANTSLYSATLKHRVVLDVISLASGFVLRVLAGCAATAIAPSLFLMNVTFFLAMFLAFG